MSAKDLYEQSRPETAQEKGPAQGLAAVFYDPRDPGTQFELMTGIFERIDPHCFDDFLRSSSDVVILWNHDVNHLLGRRSAGTLSLSVDTRGLRYSVITPDTGLGHDLTTLARRGDITGSSFAFIVDQVRWHDEGSRAIRTVEKASLVDVSLVTSPAYESTTATAG